MSRLACCRVLRRGERAGLGEQPNILAGCITRGEDGQGSRLNPGPTEPTAWDRSFSYWAPRCPKLPPSFVAMFVQRQIEGLFPSA